MKMTGDRRALWVLAGLVLAAHGLGAWALGFYNDDYSWLSTFASTGSRSYPVLAAALKAAQPGDVAARVMAIVFGPGLYSLFGTSAWLYQLFYLLLDFLVAWGLYRWLVEEGVDEGTALIVAGLAALYPNHDATHHWLVCAPAPAALAGVLAALRLQRRGARENRPALRAGAVALFFASALLYESSALLAFVPFVLDSWRARRPSFARSWELPAALAAVVLYQRGLVPRLLGHERHPMSPSLGHAWTVFRAGLECTILNRLTHSIARSASWAAANFGAGDWARLGFGVAIVVGAGRELPPRQGAPSRLILVLATAFFVFGYAPYALDLKYTPEIFTANNRLNLVGSLGGACVLAWLFQTLKARTGKVLLAATALSFLLADRASLAQWRGAAERQEEVLSGLAPKIEALCANGGTLLLYGIEERVGTGVVFESTFDFHGALRLRFGCRDLTGLVGQGRVRFEKNRAVLSWFGERELSYAGLHAYDARRGALVRISNEKAGAAFVATLSARVPEAFR